MRVKKYVIYGLTDPRDGLIYYVGQSSCGLARAKRHRTPTALKHDGDTLKTRWIRDLLQKGLEYGFKLLEQTRKIDLGLRERAWIDKLRREGHPLTNSISMRRRPFSEEHRRRLKEAAQERGRDPAYRRKMQRLNLGRVVTDETRARQSLAQRLRGRRAIEKRRRSEVAKRMFTGRPKNDATRLAIARAHGARPFCDQFGVCYESVRQAARHLNVDSSAISKVLRGKLQHAKGYVFTYLPE